MNEILISPQVAVTLVLAVIGSFFGFGRVLLSQFERRLGEKFEASTYLNTQQMESIQREIERDRKSLASLSEELRVISNELPLQYVRREDWIRFSTSIDHKLDKLADLVIQHNNSGSHRG